MSWLNRFWRRCARLLEIPGYALEPGTARPDRTDRPKVQGGWLLPGRGRIPPARELFAAYKPPASVVPAGTPPIAMDWAAGLDDDYGLQRMYADSALAEGQAFPGFSTLAMLAQRGEFRLIADVISTEMTRKWIVFKSESGEDKSESIRKIEAEFRRLRVQDVFREATEHDSFFGRSHIFMDFGGHQLRDPELAKPLGDGREQMSSLKVGKGSLKRLQTIEPMWVYPQSYKSDNPLGPEWYRPDSWWVMGAPVHASRLLTFVSREVPDILKPAYAFSGLSMTQMATPYVNNWLAVRQGVTDIVKSFCVWVLKTKMSAVLDGGGAGLADLETRLQFFSDIRTTQGTLAVDKDKEDFQAISAPLGTLDHLQAQAQEHMASISRIPLVKLTGISPTGLNATSEFEMDCFEDFIHSEQEKDYRPNLETLLRFVQLSLFGKVDEDITFEFVPLSEMTPKEKAELRKLDADTGEVLVRSKAVSSAEERGRVVADQDGPYRGLDPEAAVTYPMTELEKAQFAQAVASTVATLAGESIISVPTALKEFRKSADVSGIGTLISDEDVEDAENEPPAPGESELDEDGNPLPAAGSTGGGAVPPVRSPAASRGQEGAA